ncbi:hypothetical protein AJ80_05182 [Polytolypa hystricis UAMH7299]|uniref:Uncharacterized protein n=1 Tax=Polytolypa hystricis (strain UAMH7299) TaxID=1447883 RepID=A0A2B7Y7B5_POLH7|nr:hypothetical protein AJ80_05182 [Polytolypa hystricis UAMH7299]
MPPDSYSQQSQSFDNEVSFQTANDDTPIVYRTRFDTVVTFPPYTPLRRLIFTLPEFVYHDGLRSLAHNHLELTSAKANRPLTQEETNAFAEHVYEASVWKNLTWYAFTASAIAISYVLGDRPFKEGVKPSVPPGSPLVPFQWRRFANRRTAIFVPAGMILGSVFGSQNAGLYAQNKEKTDPRLTAYNEDKWRDGPLVWRQRMEQRVRELDKIREQRLRALKEQAAMPESRQATDPFAQNDEQSSSYGGAQPIENSNIVRALHSQRQRQRAQNQGDYQQQQQQQQQPQPSQPDWTPPPSPPVDNAWESRDTSYTSSSNDSSSSSDFFSDSDNSPISQSDTSPSSSSSSGSAWDRIRRESTTNSTEGGSQQAFPSQFPQRRQRALQQQEHDDDTSASYGSSSSPSSYDQNKQWEREQAQKEFDKLLERERQLGSSGGGAYDANGSGGRSGWGGKWS